MAMASMSAFGCRVVTTRVASSGAATLATPARYWM